MKQIKSDGISFKGSVVENPEVEKGKKWLKLTMGSRNPILPPSLKKIIAPTGKTFRNLELSQVTDLIMRNNCKLEECSKGNI